MKFHRGVALPPARKLSAPVRRILVTAGPTREMLDPVRFITNLSTGEMGYALAAEGRRKGLEVTLISGPTSLQPPAGVRFVSIATVSDLQNALRKHFFKNDLLIMSAAVGDFIPVKKSSSKIPRKKCWKMTFRQAPDLVEGLALKKGPRTVVGFSLETRNWLQRSRQKLAAKHLDGIVANYWNKRHNPFGRNAVHVALISRSGIKELRAPSKKNLAPRLLKWAIALRGLKKL